MQNLDLTCEIMKNDFSQTLLSDYSNTREERGAPLFALDS